MSQTINWILIVIGALLILLEVLLGAITGFDLLLIGSAILLGGILGLVSQSAAAGIAAGGILALIYVFIGRKRIRNRLKRKGIPSNIDALLGRNVLVSEVITPDRPGRVKFEGEEWRAHVDGPEVGVIEPGHRAVVTRIDGVTAFVVRAEPAKPPGGVGS